MPKIKITQRVHFNRITGSRFSDKDIEKMFCAIIASRGRLTEWERDFVSSLQAQFKDNPNFTFSQKQLEILEWVYTEKTPN